MPQEPATTLPFTRRDIAFDADGITLRGWLYRPAGGADAPAPAPAIVMSGGYGTSKEMFVDRYAEKFAARGYLVVLYDQRGFGASDGRPRAEIDPWRQVEDIRHALTYACGLAGVDAQRVGLWGSSYSGGHAIVAAAGDRRVRCVAAQVPTIGGGETARRRVGGAAERELLARFAADRQGRAR
uniref:alpha/beta hydrolase n=1 Tax=Janthinobacterium sp. TaxID=1871054 RepID=UPI00293D743F